MVLVPHESEIHSLGNNHKVIVDKTTESSGLLVHCVVAGINGNPTSTYLAGSTFYGVETDALPNHVDHHPSEVPTCKRETEGRNQQAASS